MPVFTTDSTELSPSTVPQSQQIYFNGKPRKVLVVDENDDNRFLLVSYLHSLGFILEQTKNATEGLPKAQIFEPDVIVLDSASLALNAQEAIADIRRQPKLQDVIIFVIFPNGEADIQPLAIGCDAFLSNPVDLDEFLGLLKTHLQLDWIIPGAKAFSDLLSKIVSPPEAELIELLKLVRSGNIDAIESKIKFLEEMNSQYNLFIREAQQITDKFQLDNLISFIEKLLEKISIDKT